MYDLVAHSASLFDYDFGNSYDTFATPNIVKRLRLKYDRALHLPTDDELYRQRSAPVSYTHLRAHETRRHL
eukprot:12767270-Prorocentrum_lima.AAC.1